MPLQLALILSSCWSHKWSLSKECPTPNFYMHLSRVPPKHPGQWTLYYHHHKYCINHTFRRSTVWTPGDLYKPHVPCCALTQTADLCTNTLPKTLFPITYQQRHFFKARNHFHRYAKQPENFLYMCIAYVCMYVCMYVCTYSLTFGVRKAQRKINNCMRSEVLTDLLGCDTV